ncbi:MAG: Hsp20/alpha crystallin family protein [Deltaproteobacteria bacterium]|nr:Hsp20/alpha crystallin family protein [Deltaproteobacteria bacterium]
MAKEEKSREQKGALAPSRPISDLARMEREMERMFEDFFSPRWFRRGASWLGRRRGAEIDSVDVDVYEDKDEIVAKAELPGMNKEDISVEVSDHILTIKGEKKKEEETKDDNYYYSERSYGSFVRTVELPMEVKTENAKANFKNGVLEIRLPKTEEAKRKQIAVRVE